jgi:hypothetical protein
LNSSQALKADKFPYSGISMIGTGAYGNTISSVKPYFFLNYSLFYKSLIAAKSSGASLGTEVTTPVPLSIEIVSIGHE